MALPNTNPVQARSASTSPSVGDTDVLSVDFDHDDDAPSREALLRRAAELGPRMTWASIRVQASDPILGAKMTPRVVERRARLRRLVQAAVGACVACCLFATVASAFSSTPGVSATGSTASSPAASGRNTPVVSVEKLEIAERTKAPSHVVAAARPASAPKFIKRR